MSESNKKKMIFLYKIGGPFVRQDGRMFHMGEKFEDTNDLVRRFGADKFDRLPDRTKIPPENRLGAPAPVKEIEPLPPRSGDIEYEEDFTGEEGHDPAIKETLEAMDVNQLKEFAMQEAGLDGDTVNRLKTKKSLIDACMKAMQSNANIE